jgi:hypothetical protein
MHLRCPICDKDRRMTKDKFIRHLCTMHGTPYLLAIVVWNLIALDLRWIEGYG